MSVATDSIDERPGCDKVVARCSSRRRKRGAGRSGEAKTDRNEKDKVSSHDFWQSLLNESVLNSRPGGISVHGSLFFALFSNETGAFFFFNFWREAIARVALICGACRGVDCTTTSGYDLLCLAKVMCGESTAPQNLEFDLGCQEILGSSLRLNNYEMLVSR